MKQVDLIRRYTLKKVNEIRLFISSLPEREQVALERLCGSAGTETAARIAEFVLSQLGHVPPAGIAQIDTPAPTRDTLKAARKAMPTIEASNGRG